MERDQQLMPTSAQTSPKPMIERRAPACCTQWRAPTVGYGHDSMLRHLAHTFPLPPVDQPPLSVFLQTSEGRKGGSWPVKDNVTRYQ